MPINRDGASACVVSIHQPAYLPWLGYLDRIRRSDIFVYLDNVQFQKNSFQNRNKIRTAQGWTWLTVPLLTKHHLQSTLAEAEINNATVWQRKHLDTIAQNYARAPFRDKVLPWLRKFYETPQQRLADMCWNMLNAHLAQLDIKTKLVRASALGPIDAHKQDLVLELCRRHGATKYISGPLGRNYIDEAAFAAARIDIVFDDYRHPVYRQAHAGFEPYMAAIDLMMNVDDALPVLATGTS